MKLMKTEKSENKNLKTKIHTSVVGPPLLNAAQCKRRKCWAMLHYTKCWPMLQSVIQSDAHGALYKVLAHAGGRDAALYRVTGLLPSSPSETFKYISMYKLYNIFVKIAKYICSNLKTYLCICPVGNFVCCNYLNSPP